MKISVVIPAYNEEQDIEKAILAVEKALHADEIIVVNDASTDRTVEILEGMQRPYIKILTNEKNMGHGYSVVRGLKEARGNYVLYIDADRQIDVDKFVWGFDVVSGIRLQRNDKLFRKIISFCLKSTNLLFHHYYIRDANCPFKIYKRTALVPLLDRLPKSYIVPIACLEVLARRHGFSTLSIPTPHKPYEGTRKGFLQILNLSALKFFSSAFFEVVRL